MDTGSGKTHIAIERARAELEVCQENKLVWFFAPTVALCEQQYEVFKANLPGYGIQLLSGKDDVDHWTEQSVWDAVLLNVRIVVSTHRVFLDALTHAFVKMDRLALLIFDEAHHCTLNHPANLIMSDFYMPRVGKKTLPKILGLSASPVQTSKVSTEDLRQIERNLCATARTPKIHRSELMRYVHQPLLVRVDYPVKTPKGSHILSALQNAFQTYDLSHDPYVLELLKQRRDGYDVQKQIEKVSVSKKTYCRDQLKSLLTKAEAMAQELGIPCMEWYMHQTVTKFAQMVGVSDSQLLDLSVDEKSYLLNYLTRLLPAGDKWSASTPLSLEHLAQKVELLIDTLVTQSSGDAEFTCLIFVEQRAWVAVLAEILSLHPRTKGLLKVGTFVGTSQSSKRKANIATLAEPRNQQASLDQFRTGRLNVILATSVLEEGIDVSSCHLVICFERPKNLKSFIQRRGRARKQESKHIIFVPEAGSGRPVETWQSLEEEMKKAYLDDQRQVKDAEERELQADEGKRFFEVPATGALLTLDNASQHLHHFCALLGSGPYIDSRPQFDFTETERGEISARVTLPISVPNSAVRTAHSSTTWVTERMAKQDAAFEAYTALYKAGLVNDNLLPARQETDTILKDAHIPDNMASLIKVSQTFDPWPSIAQCQRDNPTVYFQTVLTLRGVLEEPIHMLMLLPTALPAVPDIELYWGQSTTFTVSSVSLPSRVLVEAEIATLQSNTYQILYSIFQSRMESGRCDFLYLLTPCDASGHVLSDCQNANWGQGVRRATALISDGRQDMLKWGLISQDNDARKYIPRITHKAASGEENPLLQLVKLPKRRDFLHPVLNQVDGNDAHTRVEELAASQCVVDELPASYSVFAVLFPSILHRLTVAILADTLRTTLLAPVAFDATDLPIMIRALTASATDDENYQRLEFLGDCILKFVASTHLMADNIDWPESYLTAKKGAIVSNGFLARASLAAGLDKFVIAKRFTASKWSPRYSGNVLASTEPAAATKIERSSKLIADVVESLIGASYVVGGFDEAFLCIQTLLPLEAWTPIAVSNATLTAAAPEDTASINLRTLETLVGYTFQKKMLLLEALTHASFRGANTHTHSSYERLEFLGDAVLDYIVSRRLYAHDSNLPHNKMHGIRSAMVNASFLAFRMFEMTIVEEATNKSTMLPEVQHRALWQFLRSGSIAVNVQRDVALKQHKQSREEIIAGLQNDIWFPWQLLALTDAPKFLSDIVESVIGAIYVDSYGDFARCEDFIRRLGILDCLERILRDEVDCFHPKERLGVLAVDNTVQYVCVKDDREAGGSKEYSCRVMVGGKEVGGVVKGLKRLNAETMAAWNACMVLSGRRDVIMEDASDGEEFFEAHDGGGVMLDD